MPLQILTINPGSTSTKLAIFQDGAEILVRNLSHSAEELAQFKTIIDQYEYRLEKITDFLAEAKRPIKDFAAIVGRGGLLKPMASGTYRVNQAILDDLRSCRYGAHASNLGALLAARLADEAGCPASVSYTHLDVYKRQSITRPAQPTGSAQLGGRVRHHFR